jgi:hypothetical protein
MTTSHRFAPPATRQETDETLVVRFAVIAIGWASSVSDFVLHDRVAGGGYHSPSSHTTGRAVHASGGS